jgi:hypothetical protein
LAGQLVQIKGIGMSIRDVLKDVELAFRQLEFAIKLMCYCENNELDQKKFDSDITLLFKNDNWVFSDNSLVEYKEIVKCSQINVGICFGVSAIVLDSAFEAASFSCKRRPLDDIRTIVYMVRCAFAHNMADPKWKVTGDFQRQVNLTLAGKTTLIDLGQLNGKPFRYENIGELPNWYRIKDVSVGIIKNAKGI